MYGRGGINAFFVNDKNIFIGSGQTIIVLDTDGNIRFTLDTDRFIVPNSFIQLGDRRVAHSNWDNRTLRTTLTVINTETEAWGDTLELPVNTSRTFNGFDDFLLIYSDGVNLLAIDRVSGEEIQIINWTSSGVESSIVDVLHFLPDDRILLITKSPGTGRSDLIILNKTPRDEVPEKIVLTIASTMSHQLSVAVSEFNRTNSLYSIEIIEVAWDGTATETNKLLLEIITGRGPDMINTYNFPFHHWAGQGLFIDLYEFIDADPVLNRSDILESVLRNTEINGKLYQISPDFWVGTIIGHPDIVGSNRGWTIDEFIAVLNENPQASRPFGEWYDGRILFYYIIRNDFESFVNWETGTVNFDNDYFIGLLEFVYELDKSIVLDPPVFGVQMASQELRLISSGEQIMKIGSFFRIYEYSAYQDMFGGEFVFKGFPVANGSGNSLDSSSSIAISSNSKNQQGAWEFVRLLMSEGYQRHSEFNTMPTLKSIFDERLSIAMDGGRSEVHGDFTVLHRPLTQEDVDDIMTFINSLSSLASHADPLWDIIEESLSDFYNGAITAQDAARIIQNRASTYVAEQG